MSLVRQSHRGGHVRLQGLPDERSAIEPIARALADYSVGFAELTRVDNIEDGSIIGSGTLVTVGKLAGVVTARHVAEVLLRLKARSGARAQIVRMPTKNGGQVRHELDLRQAEFVLSSGYVGPNGPDLAFVVFSAENETTLKATSSFYPLDRDLPSLKGKYPALVPYISKKKRDFTLTAASPPPLLRFLLWVAY